MHVYVANFANIYDVPSFFDGREEVDLETLSSPQVAKISLELSDKFLADLRTEAEAVLSEAIDREPITLDWEVGELVTPECIHNDPVDGLTDFLLRPNLIMKAFDVDDRDEPVIMVVVQQVAVT